MKARQIMGQLAAAGAGGLLVSVAAAERLVLNSVVRDGDRVLVAATLPAGYGHVVLEGREALLTGTPEALIAGALNGGDAVVTFRVPVDSDRRFLNLRAGPEPTAPESTWSGPGYLAVTYLSDVALNVVERVDHALNRLAYGPGDADNDWINGIGLGAYLGLQFAPEQIDEAANARLQAAEAALFTSEPPRSETPLVRAGALWRYAKGTQAPPPTWNQPGFDDAEWLRGATGIGYGDDDDATVLEDMRQTADQPGYLTVFMRRSFRVADPAAVDQLVFRVDYDDGFVAWLNGVEVARANVTGATPRFDQRASDTHEAGDPVEIDLTARKGLLQAGANLLAIQVHNYDLTSSDLTMIPVLLDRTLLPGDPLVRIRGVDELQQLAHVRGAYARRQMQAVLAEFWENHFTTDLDKVTDYFDDLENADGTDAMPQGQARAEAAQAEFEEYQFFHDHALDNFGDLLLYSATSPPMLIYLDSVLNVAGAPNENYAREILELFGFGVDNRYTQTDIEQLARCFTGWTVRKVEPALRPAFPASAREPLTGESVQFTEAPLIEVGPGWKYFKGRSEPSPGNGGEPSVAWTEPAFADATWLTGATSIGYGDNDDATVLEDMRGSYVSVYLRRAFTLAPGEDLEGLVLSARFDDGFVAYLNGVEVARSDSMEGTGTPPAFDRLAASGHEVTRPAEVFSLEPFVDLLRPAPEVNVLAIQAHNVTLNSSDLSIHPRLVRRTPLPGSIENGDPYGSWVFRFNPDQHDTGSKQLFPGTPYAITIPAGRTGVDGVRDAIDVIDAMVAHPSTREFICLKLINKFVSDDINLVSFHNGTAPVGLRRLMNDAMTAWMSSSPPGNIGAVLRAIVRPATQDGYFWSQSAYRNKVKTPVEFINSSLRALDATAESVLLPEANASLGMQLFTRDDPDGWSEIGLDWMDTSGLLARIRFLQALAGNLDTRLSWDAAGFLAALPDPGAAGIVDHFNHACFGGLITAAQREVLIRFGDTDEAGRPAPLDPRRADYQRRAQELIALILALPQWQNQ
ncbi:MAG: DUF1800 family protein [Verrucomicrobiales bacterium]|nr:DUF1800 family protein [Verrucomicrobiales bacterium]